MEMIEGSHLAKKEKKIYTMGQISVATLLTGPLTGIYLMNRNFEVLGHKEYSQKTIIIGVVFILFLSGLLFFLPDHIVDSVPDPLIGIVCWLLINATMRKYQYNMLHIYLENGGKKHSGWRVFGIGILCMLIFFLSTMLLSLIFSTIESIL